jgi:threonylcarbamoyladenosine tRNA methylthiotransferase MtaB
LDKQQLKTVAIYTLGCKVNQSESQSILDAFRERGWQPVSFDGQASVYIVNTCTVTQAADQKSGKAIRGVKKRAPGAMLAVTGCFVENAESVLEGMPEIDMILGNGQKGKLPELVEEAWQEKAWQEKDWQEKVWQEKARQEEVWQEKTAVFPDLDTDYATYGALKGLDRSRAFLKLQDGCQQYCRYCIIPYVRKDWYSMPTDEALRRVGELAEAGYREVVLLGIHLGAYGQECGEPDKLPRVLERLLDAYPSVRFRLGSLEPMEASEKLLTLIQDYPNVCKHLHLPLQSGADAVLQAMGRPYRVRDYRGKVQFIREMMPDIALTTDIMVGFPGEGEEEFHQSMSFAEEMAFSRIHVFAYSRRVGTPAADMPGQIAGAVKNKRSAELIRLGQTMGERYGDRWIGRKQWVLIEEGIGGGSWIGHSDNYLEVTFTPPKKLPAWEGVSLTTGDMRGSLLPLRIAGRSSLKKGAWHGEIDENTAGDKI